MVGVAVGYLYTVGIAVGGKGEGVGCRVGDDVCIALVDVGGAVVTESTGVGFTFV